MKRLSLVLMMLALTVTMIAGCRTVDQEESASTDGYVENVDNSENEPNDDLVKVEPNQTVNGDDDETPSGNNNTPKPDNNTNKPGNNTDKPSDDNKKPDAPIGDDQDDPIFEEDESNIDYSDYMTIASYNIKCLTYGTNDDAVVEVLREIDADIVGLQEIDIATERSGPKNQLEFLAKELNYPYYRFTKAIDYQGGEYGTGILSRFPIKDVQRVAYSAGDDCYYARHILDVDGREVVFYNTHLNIGADWEPAGQQFYELCKTAYTERYPTIITGDFNLSAFEQTKRVHTGKLIPLNGGEDRMFTVEGISWDNILISHDFHYYTDEDTMTHIKTIISDASDHNPVYSYIKLK